MSNFSRPMDLKENLRAGDLRWSRSEKTVARKAFDAALNRELQELIEGTKRQASRIKEPSELWDLERLLTQRRKHIDRKYDSRYSRLTDVLGRLLYEKRLSEEDLRGLGDEKLRLIRSFAQFLAEHAA